MNLTPEKENFFSFLISAGALQFGSFNLKSGRTSPYFFNSAKFQTGLQLEKLGSYFANVVQSAAPEATLVFGPAYKGIPLCISTAQALGKLNGREIGYLFNRKEQKKHGDQGMFVGHLPEKKDRLVLVDDVITDGETKREAVELLRKSFQAPIDALVIAFDRMELSSEGQNAVMEFQGATGIPVHSIFTLADLEEVLTRNPDDPDIPPDLLENIRAYRKNYGTGQK